MHTSVPVSRCLAMGLISMICGAAALAQTLPATQPACNGMLAEIQGLPVQDPASRKAAQEAAADVRCLLSLEQILAAVKDGPPGGLLLDLTASATLLDGTAINPPDLYGMAYFGPSSLDSAEAVGAPKRFVRFVKIEAGKALLPIADLPGPVASSQKAVDQGQIVLRLELYLARPGRDRALGVYDTFAGFRRQDEGFRTQPCLIEGPFISRLCSDDPSTAVVSFLTSQPVRAKVTVDGKQTFSDPEATIRHEIEISGLEPNRQYRYHVDLGATGTPNYMFSTAPPRGEGAAVFAFAGGSGEQIGSLGNATGVNMVSLDRMLGFVQRSGAQFLIVGGDLVSGRTSAPEDFRMQLHAWKQAATSLGHSKPIYTMMGRGESVVRAYKRADKETLLDRWPYAGDSAESIFAQAFTNPLNGPAPTDLRRPSYRENVYSLQYGTTKIICLNTSYWYSSDPAAYGGNPEGYILDDQMAWLTQQLDAAEEDATVRFTVVFLSQPALPNGGRVVGGMWAGGDNALRPYHQDASSGQLQPAALGLLERRNEFLRLIDRCRKLAAVVSAGDHAYCRMLVGNQVPVGDPVRDDKTGIGRIGQTCSPLTDLKYPTWYLVSGGVTGSPDAEAVTPWNTFWKQIDKLDASILPAKRRYRYLPQESFLVFQAVGDTIAVTAYSPYGDILDRYPDLLKNKRDTPRTQCCTEY